MTNEVYDFHHTDPAEKDFGIAQIHNFKECVKEAEKCILLCSNCHRVFHAREDRERVIKNFRNAYPNCSDVDDSALADLKLKSGRPRIEKGVQCP